MDPFFDGDLPRDIVLHVREGFGRGLKTFKGRVGQRVFDMLLAALAFGTQTGRLFRRVLDHGIIIARF